MNLYTLLDMRHVDLAHSDLHLFRQLHVELSCSQEPQHGQGVESFRVASLLQQHSELVNSGILLFRSVPRVT